MFEELFKKFIRDKEFVANLSPRTLHSYRQVFDRWKKYVGAMPTKDNLDEFIIGMRQAGLSPVTCNISIRSFNSFLSWLSEKGHIPEPLKIKKLKEEKKIMRTFSDAELTAILNWK